MRTSLAALGAVSILLVSGCSTASTPDASTDTSGNYPLTIENCGRDVVVDAPPQRAVSLNQSSTEILLSLGLADRMVGTATWTLLPLPGTARLGHPVMRGQQTLDIKADADTPQAQAQAMSRLVHELAGRIATQLPAADSVRVPVPLPAAAVPLSPPATILPRDSLLPSARRG